MTHQKEAEQRRLHEVLGCRWSMWEGKGTQGGTVRPHDAPAPLGYLFSWLYSVFCHTGGDTLHNTGARGSTGAGDLQTHPSLADVWVPASPGTSAQYRFGAKEQPTPAAQPALVPRPAQGSCLPPAWSPHAQGLHSCWPQLSQHLVSLASRQLLHFCKMGKKSKLFALLKHLLNSCSFPPLACYFLTQTISLT